MRIDLNTILDDTEYTPRIGDEYEVAPGSWVKLKTPTIALQTLAIETAEKEGVNDLDLAKVLCHGDELPDSIDECVPLVVSRVVLDFFTLWMRIVERVTASQTGSPPLATQEKGSS